MARTLSDKVIIITGASSGIGAATALACADAGMHVVLNGRDTARLDHVAAQVRARGRLAETVVGDVTEAGMSARLLDAAFACHGRFDVVFANAGYGLKQPTHELPEADLRHIFDVNFFAATDLLCEAARRLIAERRGGHLLMCSSCLAVFTMPGFAAYSASKAAQHHVCRSMRMDLRTFGIEVSSVHPIGTDTGFVEVATVASKRLGGNLPMHVGPRWMMQRPETVARAVVRCLRRPNPEVWTSFSVRLAAGLMRVCPRLMDLVARLGQARQSRQP
ncbi:MAG: SDR family oxidoreductase [Phycisphaerae bacterium]|nr:SDR family oxidoreductase [Phycisphaerae bacterium]